MRTLTAKFLCTQFINEFRDNQKMDLQSFAAKVQRKYNMLYLLFMQNLFPQNPDPTLDPSHKQDHMVYMMGQEVMYYTPSITAINPCSYDMLD
jgi:hypothetical protein